MRGDISEIAVADMAVVAVALIYLMYYIKSLRLTALVHVYNTITRVQKEGLTGPSSLLFERFALS